MINSLTIQGIPKTSTHIIYIRIKAAPPFSPVIYGKRHTLPNPTAEPAVARITPSLLPKFALSSDIFKLLS
jgi:hypothetical protein